VSCRNVCVIAVRSFVIAAFAAFGGGCKPNFPESPTPTPQLGSIQLHYNSPHVSVTQGGTVSLTLYAIDTEGIFQNVTNQAAWSSIDPTTVTVTPGVARAVRGGIVDVIASYGGLTTTARIIAINAGQPVILRLLPESDRRAGTTSQARAMLGTTLDVTPQAAWSSSDSAVLTVTGGAVTHRAPGTAAVTATYNNTSATYYVSVPPITSLPPLP